LIEINCDISGKIKLVVMWSGLVGDAWTLRAGRNEGRLLRFVLSGTLAAIPLRRFCCAGKGTAYR
jgi:hypothetical protein